MNRVRKVSRRWLEQRPRATALRERRRRARRAQRSVERARLEREGRDRAGRT